ncbi:MAG: TetR/AcrR family transcriptional regulator [Christensenella sp.]
MGENSTKKKIKEIALELFQKNGFDSVTINEICEQSGVNKHTFYYYFASKGELLKDYYELPYDVDTEYFMEILNASNYVEQLWISYKPFLDHISASGIEIARQLFIKSITHEVGAFRGHEKHHSYLKLQVGIIEKGQAAGEIRNSSEPKSLCVLIHQTFVSTVFMWCMHKASFDLPLYARAGIETVLDVLPELRQNPEFRLTDIWVDNEQ